MLNKYVFYIYAPKYTHLSSGVRVLYILCDMLNKIGYESYVTSEYSGESYYAPMVTPEIIKKNKDLGKMQIAIYPEVMMGNPLQSKYVIRWMLNKPNNFFQNWLGDFSKDEFIVHHDESFRPKWINSNKQHIPHLDRTLFNMKNTAVERSGVLVYEHRNKVNEKLINNLNNITFITTQKPLTPLECSALYKKSKMLIVAERTAAHAEAALCGCPTVFVANDKFNLNYVFETFWKISSFKEFKLNISELNQGNGFELEKIYDDIVRVEKNNLEILIKNSIKFFEGIREKPANEIASILIESCNNLIKNKNYKDALTIMERVFELQEVPNRAYYLYYKICRELNNDAESNFAQNYLYQKVLTYADNSFFDKIFDFNNSGKLVELNNSIL